MTPSRTPSTVYLTRSGRVIPDGAGGVVTQSLSWDAEGELEAVGQDGNGDGDVADAGEAVAGGGYVYTADGDRLVRHQGVGDDRTTTVYLPGGQEVTASASGEVSAVRYYSFAGQTVAMRTGMRTDEMISISPDHHGTGSVQITNLTSTVTRRYTDPFGAERGSAGPSLPGAGVVDGWAGDHGFLDKPADGTGLTAVGARMYDPGLGVFVSVDPIMDLTDPQQWNGYAYAHNNPTTYSDPTGLREFASSDPRQDGSSQIKSAVKHTYGGGPSSRGSGGGGSRPLGSSGGEVFLPVLTYPVLSPDVCPVCWGLAQPSTLKYPDYRPQWLTSFEGAHPNIAAYTGISDHSGCFLHGGYGDSCGYVMLGVMLAPIGGAAAGVGIKAGTKALGRASAKTVASRSHELLRAANAARDAEMARLTTVRSADRPPTVVGAFNIRTGGVAVGQSSKLLGECAEACAVRMLGGNSGEVRFTRALRPNGSGAPFREIPVCSEFCEPAYGRGAFPDPKTRFRSDEVG